MACIAISNANIELIIKNSTVVFLRNKKHIFVTLCFMDNAAAMRF